MERSHLKGSVEGSEAVRGKLSARESSLTNDCMEMERRVVERIWQSHTMEKEINLKEVNSELIVHISPLSSLCRIPFLCCTIPQLTYSDLTSNEKNRLNPDPGHIRIMMYTHFPVFTAQPQPDQTQRLNT